MQINNEVEVNIDLHSVTTFVEVLLKIREQKFLNFPLRDIPNIYCWLATIFAPTGASMNPRERGIALEDYAFLVDSLNLNISCISCTSPLFGNLLSDLYTPSDSEDATDTVKQTAGQVLDGDAIQSFFDQFVSDSSKNCPHSSDYDPNASELVTEYMKNPAKPFGLADFSVRDSRSSYFNIANGIFAGLLLALLVGGKWWVHRRNNEWKQSLSDEGAFLLRRQGAKENEEEAILDFYGSSLFRDPHIPIKIRLLVPVMMVINIGLYLGGHCGVLSTVDVDVQLAGEEFTIHQMLDFSFFSSTAKTYQNGGMEMSIMVSNCLLTTLILCIFKPHSHDFCHNNESIETALVVWIYLAVREAFCLPLPLVCTTASLVSSEARDATPLDRRTDEAKHHRYFHTSLELSVIFGLYWRPRRFSFLQ